jgi:hypothetical protein
MRPIRLAAALLATGAALAARADAPVISGKAYADLTYRNNVDGGADAARADSGTAFDLKRFYLGVDQKFDDVWAARLRTDVGNLTNGKVDVFVKHAFIQAKVAPELTLRAGAADLPWVPFVEDLYGFRYVENVLIDRVKLGTSADWGLHASGGLGVLGYAVSVVNGRGYGDPTRTQAPTVEARLSLVPVKGLTIAVGGQAGKLGQNVIGTATPRTAQRYDAVVAWAGDGLRLGATGFYAKNYSKTIVTDETVPEDTAVGASGWASVEFTPELAAFGRVDWVQPKKDTSADTKDLYLNVGLQYRPVKPVSLALVFKHDKVSSGSLSTSNGTVGSATAGQDGTFDEVGLFAQYVF